MSSLRTKNKEVNFIAAADLHINYSRPIYRIDNFFDTCCFKFEQILRYAKKYNAIVLIAGDFFDSDKVGHVVVNKIIEILQRYNVPIYVTAGQHDMYYHSNNLDPSPLRTLVLAEAVTLLDRKKPIEIEGYRIYGVSFGEKIINVRFRKSNILVVHKCITPKEPPEFLKDAISAEEMMTQNKGYNVIVSGDYHAPFTHVYNKKLLVNCGPMVRKRIDEVDLKPRVYLFNIEKKLIKPLFLKIQPADIVFALERALSKKKDSKVSAELHSLINTMKRQKDRPDFENVVKALITKETPSEVKEKALEIIRKVRRNG